MTKRTHSPARREKRPASYLRACLTGGAAGAAALFLLGIPLAFVLLRLGDPSSALLPLSLTASACAGCAAGAVGALQTKPSNPFLGGLSAAGGFLALVLLLSLLVPERPASLSGRLLPPAAGILCALLIAMLVSSRRGRKKLPRRR